MQIGDPKKALVLAVVAIVILCVAAFRSIPSGAAIMKAATDAMGTKMNAQAPEAQKAPEEPLPSVLTATPFVKPTTAPKTEMKPKAVAKRSKAGGKVAPMPIEGNLPSISPESGGTSEPAPGGAAADNTGNAAPANPGENAGMTRTIDKKKEPTLTLVAILQVTKRSAVVNLDGDDSNALECHVGSLIRGYRVLSIGNSGLVLQKRKSRLEVSVGETTKL